MVHADSKQKERQQVRVSPRASETNDGEWGMPRTGITSDGEGRRTRASEREGSEIDSVALKQQ